MQKYFVSNDDFLNNIITSDDVFHIKNVMRGKIGDLIVVSNENEEYLCKLVEIAKEYVKYEKVEKLINNNELPVYVSLYQGLPKGDKLDDIIKMSTQFGIDSVIPTIMKRSIVKVDPSKIKNKTIRLNKIAKEAAEQSNRLKVPKVMETIKLDKIDFSEYDYKIVCYEESAKDGELSLFKNVVKSLNKDSKICVVIGPEGGIDESEVEYLKKLGFIMVGLGPRILRTEMAILYVLGAISYEMELK